MNLTILIALTFISLGFAKNTDLEKFLEDNVAYNYIEKVGLNLAAKFRKLELSNFQPHVVEGTTTTQRGTFLISKQPNFQFHVLRGVANQQFPYQVGLLITTAKGDSFCSGSLISSKRVITAAHCWFDGKNQATQIVAVLGSELLYSGGTRITTNEVVMHSDWTPSLVRNDIAVIYLPSDVSSSSKIAPIALPSGSQLNEDFAGSTAIASGFGLATADDSIKSASYVKHVQMDIITNDVCLLSFPLAIQPTNICGNIASGKRPCVGDSGGPLAIVKNNVHVLIGVMSFGSVYGCQDDAPVGFTRVTSYMNFINSNL